MRERSLHAALKRWYARPGDRLEQSVDGFLIDIRRGDLLIEIQTAGLAALKRKLSLLTQCRRVRLVFPIPQERWIVRYAADGRTALGRKKSPKRGSAVDLFHDLVSIPELFLRPNFSLEVLFIREEAVRRERDRPRRGRKWWNHDRRLIEVAGRRMFNGPADFLDFLPAQMPRPFATSDLAAALKVRRYLAQKAAYCLRKMGVIRIEGKRGNNLLYAEA